MRGRGAGPLRITIDVVPLLVRGAGIKNYLYYWTQHLMREPRKAEIRLFPAFGRPAALDHECSAAGPLSTMLRLELLFLLNSLPPAAGSLLGPRTDVFHTVKLLNPPRRAKLSATIHDLTCWLLPETHLPANVAADRYFAERILTRADGLIAVSESTRADAIRILRVPERKIRVIHHGVAEIFFQTGPRDAEPLRARLGLERPYLLFVGTIEPRKNLDLLLDAFEALPSSIRGEFDLVLAGPRGWAGPQTLARVESPSPGVRYLGYVSESDLPRLVAGATAFVYPSLYEGFGFPVAQAMAAGIPVITSAVSSLPEITGGAALLVDPRSVADLRGAMERVLTSPSLRDTLGRQGRENARRFTWPECARQSLRYFEDIVG